jgi:phosphoserine phosphatase RsbU/P
VGNEPAAVLGAVNHQLHTASLADRFATLFYGVFDTATRMLHYANAGHNPPMVIRRDGSIHWLETAGLPLGFFADSTYDEGAIHLRPGDTVIAYTDGVVESLNPSGEEWGVEDLRKAAVESKAQDADELVDAIFASLDQFTKGHRTDDASVVVLLAH